MFSKKLFKKINFLSSSLAQARKKSSLINPLPAYISRNLNIVKKIRNFAEAKLEWHPIGFKIGGTNPEIMNILKGKEPFYSYLFKEQTFINNKLLKLTPNTLGIELELAFKISKNIFNYQNLNRKKALIFISQSKHSIISKENTLSFFAIDCVACQLNIFHNINDKLESSIKTNLKQLTFSYSPQN